MGEEHNVTQFKYQLSVPFVLSTQPVEICTWDKNHRLQSGRHFTYTTIGKWNKTTTMYLILQRRLQVWMDQRLKSLSGVESRALEAILRVQQQQQQLFIIYLTYVIILAHT